MKKSFPLLFLFLFFVQQFTYSQNDDLVWEFSISPAGISHSAKHSSHFDLTTNDNTRIGFNVEALVGKKFSEKFMVSGGFSPKLLISFVQYQDNRLVFTSANEIMLGVPIRANYINKIGKRNNTFTIYAGPAINPTFDMNDYVTIGNTETTIDYSKTHYKQDTFSLEFGADVGFNLKFYGKTNNAFLLGLNYQVAGENPFPAFYLFEKISPRRIKDYGDYKMNSSLLSIKFGKTIN